MKTTAQYYFDMKISIGVTLLFTLHLTLAFNVQDITKGIVFTNQRRGSQFGYSVAMHENQDGKWLIVGSPKDYEGEDILASALPRDGAVYTCRLMERRGKSVIKKGKCELLKLEISNVEHTSILQIDFETKNMTQSHADDFDWELNVGPTKSENTGPQFDHTIQDRQEGKYMLLESSHPRAVGESAMLETEVLPRTNAACVRFWYNMNGDKMGSLNLYLFTNSTGSRMIWSLEGHQGEDWTEGWITVISHESYQVKFEGVIGQGYNSDIGLDDITILDGLCPENNKPTNQSLGMTLSRDADTGRLLACAPTWSYTCKGQNHATGLCYIVNEGLNPTATEMLSPCRTPSCTDGKMDLIFLIDGSDSINKNDFEMMIRWLRNVVSALPLGRYLTRVGVAQYRNRPRTEFDLNQYYKLEEMSNAIKNIKQIKGTTATGRAISFIAEVMFSKERGMRADAKHVAVVITDGKSQDNVIPPSISAKERGITIFAIGVGVAVKSELRNISSDPDDQFVYSVTSYEALDGIRAQLQKKLVALESQGSTFSTEQCQAGIAANFVNERPVMGLPGLQDWSGGFALYSDPDAEETSVKMIRTGFKDLVSTGAKVGRQNDATETGSETREIEQDASVEGSSPNEDTSSAHVSMELKVSGHVGYSNTTFQSSSIISSFHRTFQNTVSGSRLRFPRHVQSEEEETALSKSIETNLEAAGLKSSDDVVSKILAHSYLGYSIASGAYSNLFAVEMAVGGPRVLSVGSVFIIQLSEHQDDVGVNEPVIMTELSGDQMGSYFGFSVCMTDMNADGLDELLVGAPLWMGKYEDMGQTVLYLSNYDRDGIMHPRQKIILPGPSERNARFGYSIAAAGDLNRDGYADVVVGAPSTADGDGAIYIYNGGKNVDKIKKPTQVVRASGTKKRLGYFGFSIHGGIDIDDNGYLDIACGAPEDIRAVVLFTRPVIHVKSVLSATPSVVNISNSSCDAVKYDHLTKPAVCSTIDICFTVTGYKIPQKIYLYYELHVDVDRTNSHPRAYFQHFSNPGELGTITGSTTCTSEVLIFQKPLREVTKDIIISMKYSLSSMMPSTFKSPILDAHDENPVYTKIYFARDCQHENCSSDLEVQCSVDGMRSYQGSDVIVLDSSRIIDIVANLSNHAGDAYNVELEVVYNGSLFLSKLTNLQDEKCVTILYDEDDLPGRLKARERCDVKREKRSLNETDFAGIRYDGKMKTLKLMYKQALMTKNAKCAFKLQFGIHEHSSFGGGNLAISMATHSANRDVNSSDNSCNNTISVFFTGKAFVTGHSDEDQIHYGEDETTEYITNYEHIGPELSHSYFITNTGTASIPLSAVQFMWPTETKSKHDILYFTSIKCIPAQKCQCSDLDILVNPDHINTTNTMETQINRGLGAVSLRKPENETNSATDHGEEFIEVRTSCDEAEVICESLRCIIANVASSETIKIVLKFRLWKDTFLRAKIWKASVSTRVTYSTKLSPFIIPDQSHFQHEVTTVAYSKLGHQVKDDVQPDPPKHWIIIVAVAAGVVLLALMIFALQRVGFFKSKYKQMKESRQMNQDSLPHADRVNSNSDMPADERPQRLTTFQRNVSAEIPGS